MNSIECARELGKAIQQEESYIKMMAAKQMNDEDKDLQDKIGEFNLLRIQVNEEFNKSEKDDVKVKELNEKLMHCYNQIMQNENMTAYNMAKTEFDQIMNKVNGIIGLCVEGEDPEKCEPPASCSGSCSTCGGCH